MGKRRDQVQEVYEEELRDKRKAARGVHSLKGKRGLVGSVKTPADLLTGRERREYEGTSEVVTSSVYDRIMPFGEFKALPRSKRMVTLYEYRKRFKTAQIADAWQTTPNNVHYQYRSLGVGNPNKAKKAAGKGKPAAAKAAGEAAAASAAAVFADDQCDVRISGKLTGRDLARKLNGLAMMALEDASYELDLRFTEL